MKTEKQKNDNIEREIICKNCGYKWNTKSKMFWTSCPRCMFKQRIKQNEDIK
jgi:predicted Zn-ribbon and HTH transcriptional regulator